MEGIGLDNMLGAEEVDKLFSEQAEPAEETAGVEGKDESQPAENSETDETAEADNDFKYLPIYRETSLEEIKTLKSL